MSAPSTKAVKDPELFEEATRLFSSPPVPSPSPTDSFWGHFESPLNEEQLKQTPIRKSPYTAVIIGGGLTGVSVAYWLTEFGVPGDEILLVEGRELGGGATGRNGGHCWPATRVWDEKLVSRYGRENLDKAEEFKYTSATMFMNWLEENQIDCEFRRTGACELAAFDEEVKDLQEYMEDKGKRFEEKLGTKAELWDGETCKARIAKEVGNDEPVSGSETSDASAPHWKGCLFQSLSGQFWPKKAVHGIAKLAISRGVNIRTHTYVETIERHGDAHSPSFSLHTPASTICATQVVHCTNGYASKLLPHLKGVVLPLRGQIVATSPIDSFWIPHNLAFNDGFEYLIHREEDKRIIFGGNRWRAATVGKEVGVFDDSTIDENISSGLRQTLLDSFPKLKEEPGFKIDYEWTGIMGYSCDNWPLIGKLRDGQDEWIAAAYCGNGMPQCFGAARVVSQMMTGKMAPDDPWIPHFNPQRFLDPVYHEQFVYTGRKLLKADE